MGEGHNNWYRLKWPFFYTYLIKIFKIFLLLCIDNLLEFTRYSLLYNIKTKWFGISKNA